MAAVESWNLSKSHDIRKTPIAKYGDTEPAKLLQTSVSTTLRHMLSLLRPSFLGRHQIKKPRKLYSTSYLDGLRGVAALFVCFNHYVSQFFPQLAHGWKNDEEGAGKNDWLIQLPILRVVYSGRFMVTIFFIISGYVLSHRALGLARQRQFQALLKSLSSSVFRRWLRLMLPALTSAFIGFLLVRLRLAPALYLDWNDMTGLNSVAKTPENFEGARLPVRMNSTMVQFWDWAADCPTMVDPFRFGAIRWPKYNIVLWTMQVEYMGSMLVFLIVLGIALTRPAIRIAIPSLLVMWAIYSGKWIWALFITGILLSEVSHDSSAKRPPKLPLHAGPNSASNNGTINPAEKDHAPPPHRKSLARHLPDIAVFLLAIHLGTYPEHSPESSPGYRALSRLIPKAFDQELGQFYPMLGAMLLVICLENSTFLQAMFTTRAAQYLGDVSLSLYMLHTHVELSLGNWIVPRCLEMARVLGPCGFLVGMAVSLTICGVVTVLVSDLFWRVVDIKSVAFARWVSVQCFVSEEEPLER